MRVIRYLGAAVITIALLVLSRSLTVTQPEDLKSSANGLTIEHISVKKIIEGSPDRVWMTVRNPDSLPITVALHWIFSSQDLGDSTKYNRIEMKADSARPENYYALMPLMDKGNIIFYYIGIQDSLGRRLASVPPAGEKPIKLKYMGEVPPFIIFPHIILMFAAIYFATLAFFGALKVIGSGSGLLSMGIMFKWATISIFLGGYLFGWGMNRYAFGTVWEGIPFGWDFTDNKTQLVFLYLVFLILSMLGTLYNNRFGKDNYTEKALGWFGFAGYFFVLAIYLIPHSIQFSIPMTALFAYGLTAAIIILYIVGLIGKKKWINPDFPDESVRRS